MEVDDCEFVGYNKMSMSVVYRKAGCSYDNVVERKLYTDSACTVEAEDTDGPIVIQTLERGECHALEMGSRRDSKTCDSMRGAGNRFSDLIDDLTCLDEDEGENDNECDGLDIVDCAFMGEGTCVFDETTEVCSAVAEDEDDQSPYYVIYEWQYLVEDGVDDMDSGAYCYDNRYADYQDFVDTCERAGLGRDAAECTATPGCEVKKNRCQAQKKLKCKRLDEDMCDMFANLGCRKKMKKGNYRKCAGKIRKN